MDSLAASITGWVLFTVLLLFVCLGSPSKNRREDEEQAQQQRRRELEQQKRNQDRTARQLDTRAAQLAREWRQLQRHEQHVLGQQQQQQQQRTEDDGNLVSADPNEQWTCRFGLRTCDCAAQFAEQRRRSMDGGNRDGNRWPRERAEAAGVPPASMPRRAASTNAGLPTYLESQLSRPKQAYVG